MLRVGQKKCNLNHKRNILAYMGWVSMASGCHRDKLYPLWCFLMYIQNSTSVILVPIYVLFEVWMVTQPILLLLLPLLHPWKLQLAGGCSSYKTCLYNSYKSFATCNLYASEVLWNGFKKRSWLSWAKSELFLISWKHLLLVCVAKMF